MNKMIAALAFMVVALPDALEAQPWGDLQGRFLYGGDPPEPARLEITRDEQECCKHNLVDESLVVDEATHGLKNVVIFLVPAGKEVPVHQSYQEEDRRPKLDNLACRFDPRVVLVATHQTLVIGNSDPIGHNAMIDTRKNAPLNVTIPSGGTYEHRFPLEERAPVPVTCSIHPWMRGWVLVRDSPYMCVTNEQGRFEMKNVPVGEWGFAVWHERASSVTDVRRSGRSLQWKRGRVQWKIEQGENDLGAITIPASAFKD